MGWAAGCPESRLAYWTEQSAWQHQSDQGSTGTGIFEGKHTEWTGRVIFFIEKKSDFQTFSAAMNIHTKWRRLVKKFTVYHFFENYRTSTQANVSAALSIMPTTVEIVLSSAGSTLTWEWAGRSCRRWPAALGSVALRLRDTEGVREGPFTLHTGSKCV